MTIDNLYSYINSLIKSGSFPVEIKLVNINFGDKYYNECGQSYVFTIFDIEYSVGYSSITEDADDWAQAECHQVSWCDSNDKHIDPEIVHNLIQNYKSINRELIIGQII